MPVILSLASEKYNRNSNSIPVIKGTFGQYFTAAEDDDDSVEDAAAGSALCDFGVVVALTTDYHAVLFQHMKFTISY